MRKGKFIAMGGVLVTALLCAGYLGYVYSTTSGRTHPVKEAISSVRATLLGYELNGIDVSHHNGRIDWQRVAQDKRIEFVYIKASEGATYRDPLHKKNRAQARKAGIKVGAYHFYHEDVKPQLQFINFRAAVGSDWGDLIPVVDFEDIAGSADQIRQDLQTFCSLIEKSCGKKPMIYVGHSLHERFLRGYFDNYRIWADWKWKLSHSNYPNLSVVQYGYWSREDMPESKHGVDYNTLAVPLEDILLHN